MVDRRVIRLGAVDYEVRPMAGVAQGYEVWRGPDELGFFTLEAAGETAVTTLHEADEALLRRVAAEYIRPHRG